MIRFIALFALLAAPAFAKEIPDTVELPSDVVLQVQQYLGTRPFNEVAGLLGMIQACLNVQIPQNGVTVSNGQCPAVSAAIQVRSAKQVSTPSTPPAEPEKK